MKKYVLAIDQGTSSSRAIIFDNKGKIVYQASKKIDMIYIEEDFVEQKASEIWTTVLTSMASCMFEAGILADEIENIGITNQRETTILWDRRTGNPIYKAIVWQSKQSNSICDELKEQGYSELFKEKTGLLIDPYFSASKIKWVLDNIEGAKQLMDEGNLMFGTVDTWLLYKLTGEKVHKTDVTNASRTLMFNINTLEWDQEILDILGIDKSILPEVVDSNAHFGTTTEFTFFGKKVPITGILGDQQAALFGQQCFEKGEIKNTYGTGCFMLMNTGEKLVQSKNGLLTTIAYSLDGNVVYALEGSVFVAGSAIQWLRDSMKFFKEASESEKQALSVEDNYGVYFVPAFAGLGTPYWDSECKGAIYGLTRGTTREHITRATLESLAYQTKDIIEVMSRESNIEITSLKVDGGASMNNFLMQFQSDILNSEIARQSISETTALGAAFISGLSSGFYKDMDQLKSFSKESLVFKPMITEEKRNKLYNGWKVAINCSIQFKI
ncbi:MAG: glycerol kinase GlpK [Candidatus Izemoplasma sp.]